MMKTNAESSNSLQPAGPVERVMCDSDIASFIAENASVKDRAREAAKWLVENNPKAPEDDVVKTVQRLLVPLRDEKLRVFFSYKHKDGKIADQIAEWLDEWSAHKLVIERMGRLGVEGVGRDWRQQIEQTIPRCDWFLLLLPAPGERDWTVFEAGYFRGAGHHFLGGRLVCLHHPDNEIANALGEQQSVPADEINVTKFLEGLFHEPNWLPGMPPLNGSLSKLKEKAGEIMNLIQHPASPSEKSCCGPHMEVAFTDASAVTDWNQLARGSVIKSNDDCLRLFGLRVRKSSFGEWVKGVKGAGQDEGWAKELVQAVQAAGEGRDVPAIRATFSIGNGRHVRPMICALSRRKNGQIEAIDILFNEAELPNDTSFMKRELAALAITLQFAVRFRYQVLEPYVGRKFERKDAMAFYRAINDLRLEAARDTRFAEDPSLIRKETLASFIGEDKTVVQKMYERWDQLCRPDGKGEMDQAIDENKGEALEGFIKELTDMNQRFLSVTSKRFAELIAGNGTPCSDGIRMSPCSRLVQEDGARVTGT